MTSTEYVKWLIVNRNKEYLDFKRFANRVFGVVYRGPLTSFKNDYLTTLLIEYYKPKTESK